MTLKLPLPLVPKLGALSFLLLLLCLPKLTYAFACQSTGSGNWSSAGTWTSCNSTTPQSTDTVQILNGHTVTLDTHATTTSITIDSGGTLTEDGGGRILAIGDFGAWTNNGTFTAQASTIKFLGSVTITGNTTFNNFAINANSASTKLITLTGYTATTTGTFSMDNASSGNIRFTGGTIAAQGDVVWNAARSDGANSTTVLLMSGTGDQTITSNNATRTSGLFIPFNINKASGNLILASGSTIRTNTSWTYTSMGTGQLVTTGNTVVFVGQTISGSHTLNNVTFDSNSSSAAINTIGSGQTLTVAGTLTVGNSSSGEIRIITGTVAAQGDIVWDGSTNTTNSSAGLLVSGGNNQVFTISGSTVTSGSFVASTTVNKSGGTLTFSGVLRMNNAWSSHFTQTAGTMDWTTNDATLAFASSAGSPKLSMSSGNFNNIYLDTLGVLTLQSNLSVVGNWTNNGSFTSGSNTVTFTGSSDSTIVTGGTGTTKDFQNLTINKTNATTTLSTNGLDIDGTLTITAGTLDLNGQNISTVATCNNSGILKLLGTETLSCTLTNNSGSTVQFYGAGEVTVSNFGTTFFNLTATTSGKSLIFPADTTTTIGGTLTLQGAEGSPILLKSSAAGTDGAKIGNTALLSVATAGTLDYLTVYDNDASGAAAPLTPTNSTNGGNTTGWDFGEPADITSPVISNVATTTSTSTATITWDTDESATSQVEYGLDTNYGSYSTFSGSYVTSHSISLTGLTQNTTYHYRVASVDGSGNAASSTDATFNTNDNTVPQVSLIAPVTGLTVFGPQVYLSATATDDVAVAGVQFKLDTNTNIGSEITYAPYSTTWDTTGLSGSHTIIAVARDTAGNYATTTAATVTVSSAGAVYLTPGAGFSGATAQPAATGDSSQRAYNATSTARWDVVPHQTFTGTMNVGVVAFHINGIDHVSFSVNGGSWENVYTPTRNPETGVLEYWTTLRASDFADGQIEVRAIAYPVAGIPRVLQGLTAQANGEQSLLLYSNSGGTLDTSYIYVSATGNDSTGDGSESLPFLTVNKALDMAEDGQTIRLLSETTYNVPTISSGPRFAAPYNYNRWVTIEADPSIDPQNVILTGGNGRWFINHIRLHNISVDRASLALYIEAGWFAWADHVRFFDSLGHTSANSSELQSPIRTAYTGGVYATDSSITDIIYGFPGFSLVRGSLVKTIAGDSYANAKLVINSSVEESLEGTAGIHSDILQYYPNPENVIIYGLTGTNISDTQDIFLGGDPGDTMTDMAFVDITIRNNEGIGNPPFSQLNSVSKNILFQNIQTPDQSWYFRTDIEFTANNIVFKNCTLGALVSPITDGVLIYNCQNTANTSLDNAYVVNATAGSGGSISPTSTVLIASGDNQAFTITPDPGYNLATLLVDGVSVPTSTSYTFENVTADHSLSATFEAVSVSATPSLASSPNQGPLLTPSLKPQTSDSDPSLIASLQAQIQELQTQIRRLLGHSDSPASSSATFTFTQALKLGSTGPAVQALQRKLNALGYRVSASGPGSPGAETTYFGPATQQALARFQLAEKLIESLQAPVAGYLGPKTRARLNGR